MGINTIIFIYVANTFQYRNDTKNKLKRKTSEVEMSDVDI